MLVNSESSFPSPPSNPPLQAEPARKGFAEPIDELLAGEPEPITRIKPSCGTDQETFVRDGLLLVA